MNEIIEKNKLQEVFLEKGNYCVISKKTKESITKHNPQNKKNEKIIIPDSDTPGKPDQLWEAELLSN